MTIRLSDMLFYAYHGVLEQERKEGNTFRVSVCVTLPTVRATETDALEDTIDYSRLYDIVAQEMQHTSLLIEHVAWRIKKAIETYVGSTSSPQVSVTVAKHNPPVEVNVDANANVNDDLPRVEWAEVTV